MRPEDIFQLTPVAHAVAIAYGKYTDRPYIKNIPKLIERLYNGKTKRPVYQRA